MTRKIFIERTLRQIYGQFPTDDSQITDNLVNKWLNDAIASAARANYTDNLKIEGISFVNNSFYTTFKGLTVSQDEALIYKVELPEIPVGIGYNEGINTLQFKDEKGLLSQTVIMLTQNQKAYYQNMRSVPNKIIAWPEGKYVYVVSSMPLYNFTASVTMISGGDSTDLSSELNVPSDYFPQMVSYIRDQLITQRMVPVDTTNDGQDIVKTP